MVATPLEIDRPLTYEDLEALPDDGNRYELLQGDLIVSPAPGLRHQVVLKRLNRGLEDAVEAAKFGMAFIAPFDVRFSQTDVLEPDLFAVRVDQYSQLSERAFDGAPAFVVEVVSPNSGRIDRMRKADFYMKNGVEEYWIVEPQAKRVLVHLAGVDEPMPRIISEGTLNSAVIPGFSVELTALFAPELKTFE